MDISSPLVLLRQIHGDGRVAVAALERIAGGRKVVYARGYGGQMLYIVPELDLTVVVTSDPTRPAQSHGYAGQLHDLLARDIVPAAS